MGVQRCLSEGDRAKLVEVAAAVPTGYTEAINWGDQKVDSGKVNASGDMIVEYYFEPATGRFLLFNRLEWTGYEKQQVEAAFDIYESFLAVEFVETGNAADAEFRLNKVNALGFFLGIMNPPGEPNPGAAGFHAGPGATGWDQGDVFGNPVTGGLEQGGFGFITLIHEFGHGLGLAHPHDNGGGSTILPGVSSDSDPGNGNLNQGVYTTMSYVDGWNTHPSGTLTPAIAIDHGYQGTPMAVDIAILQDRYGANTTHAPGDDVYVLPDANVRGTFFSSIWDTGGTDAIVYAGSRNAVIDLRPATLELAEGGGGWISFAAGIYGGFTIAQNVVIENAGGGSGNDVLVGNGVANALGGNGGDDFLLGGAGNDLLSGDAGEDALSGDDGDDTLLGGAGNDWLFAGLGNDRAEGGNGVDNIYGSLGDDFLSGGAGNDVLTGEAGADALSGDDGDDTLRGNEGDDWMFGGLGDDLLDGGDGVDTLFGSLGDDFLLGGAGNDILTGEFGNDVLSGEDGDDTLLGNQDDDWLFGGFGNDLLDGGDGVDTLFGSLGDDFLLGGAGNDSLTGEFGADALSGGDGDDTLLGNQDDDWLFGGFGNDLLDGGDGVDNLYGSLGDDILSGGAGNDTMTGEIGSDVFVFSDGFGQDIVTDFSVADVAERIYLGSLSAITDFNDLMTNHIGQVGADVVIDDKAGNTLTLLSVNLGDLGQSEFDF